MAPRARRIDAPRVARADARATSTLGDACASCDACACDDCGGFLVDGGPAYGPKRALGAHFRSGAREWFDTSGMCGCERHAREACETCETTLRLDGFAGGGDHAEYNEFVRQYLRAVRLHCDAKRESREGARDAYHPSARRGTAVEWARDGALLGALVVAAIHLSLKRAKSTRGSDAESSRVLQMYVALLWRRPFPETADLMDVIASAVRSADADARAKIFDALDKPRSNDLMVFEDAIETLMRGMQGGRILGVRDDFIAALTALKACLLYTSPSPRDATLSRMPSSA